jgi:alkylation response protein AidB-like acyl-CoA dehydrogenase
MTEANVWVAETCLRVVQACYTLGGGSSVYEASPLQRRLRDMEAAAQHMTAHRRHYGPIGKALLAAAPKEVAKAA